MNPLGRNFAVLVAMFVAPALLLLMAAHFSSLLQGPTAYPTLLGVWLIGATGILLSPWSAVVKLIASLGYVALGVTALPFLALLAVCSTGNCI